MAKYVKFKQGKASKVTDTTKVPLQDGMIYFALDENNHGSIYYDTTVDGKLDSSSLKRIKLTGYADVANKLAAAVGLITKLDSDKKGFFQNGGDDVAIGVTGTLPTSHGGTGNTSYTANRLLYTSAANKFASATGIYSDGSSLGINATGNDGYSLYINGLTHATHSIIVDADSEDSYNEGIRVNQAKNGWSTIVLGGLPKSKNGTGKNVWTLGTSGAYNDSGASRFYIANNDRSSAATRMEGYEGSGFVFYPRVGINGSNTGYNLYVNGSSYLVGASTFGNLATFNHTIMNRTGYNVAGNGKYSYFKIATIKITQNYINYPIVFEISGRGRNFSTVSIIFQSINNTDPTLYSFNTDWDNCYFIKKTATSTWEVYGQYNEVYGYAVLHRITGTATSGAQVTINMTNIDSLPSDCTRVSYAGNVNYANSAGKITTARKIELTGSVTGSVNFDGSSNVSINTVTNHSHGLMHQDFTVTLSNDNTNNQWTRLGNTNGNGFWLKSVKGQANTPNWFQPDFSAGIAFGGADTKGVMSVRYSQASVRFAGGNGAAPVWFFTINGASGQTYDLTTLGKNTASATKLQTARRIYIDSVAADDSSKTMFDGTANACLLLPRKISNFENIQSTQFQGNLAGSADKVDGYHFDEAPYVYNNTYNQPTSGATWQLKISTDDWNRKSETIYIETNGNNRRGVVILKAGSRQYNWWGYATQYNGVGILGVYKTIGNSDNVYIKIDGGVTSVKIKTTFSPKIVNETTSDSNYTTVPSEGGFFSNSIYTRTFQSISGWFGNKYLSEDNWIGWYATKGNTGSTRYGYIQNDLSGNGNMHFRREQGGNFDFNGHLLPSSSNAYNLGSTGATWNNLYLQNIFLYGQTKNRLVWTNASQAIQASSHYADSTHIAVNDSKAATAGNITFSFTVNGSSYLGGTTYVQKDFNIRGDQSTDDSTHLRFLASDNTLRALISFNGNTDDSYNSSTHLKIMSQYGDIRLSPKSGSVNFCKSSIRNLAVGGGIYWDPYVESATDATDAASITVIKTGAANGTELCISQQNDANDIINLVAPAYIYLNSKRAFIINDSWLRINEGNGFSSGVYFGTSIVRTDNVFQVGNSGNSFYANNSGLTYIKDSLNIGMAASIASSAYRLNIQGGKLFYHDDGSLMVYTINNTQNTGYGTETIAIQTCFDNQDPSTSGYVTQYEQRCNLLLQPRGGQVYIGQEMTTDGNTTFSLHVKGGISVTDGYVSLAPNRYTGPGKSFGMICNNSDIVGLNGLFAADIADNFAEGYNFYRTSTTYDAMAAKDGIFYFGSNVPFGGALTGSATINAGAGVFNNNVAIGAAIKTAYKLYVEGESWIKGKLLTQDLLPEVTKKHVVGNASYVWANGHFNVLNIFGNTNTTMTSDTTNPRIIFSENGTQSVGIVYTDTDAYRASKGLKIMDVDGSDAGNVWLEVQGEIWADSHIRIPNNKALIQNQSDSSNYTSAVLWYKGGKSQATYNPQIGQHNTGGDGNGSICILPYATTTDPWNQNVGLFVSKGLLKLDGKRISTCGDASGNVGNNSRFIYSSGGTLTASTATIGNSTIPVYVNNGTFTPITSYSGNAATASKLNTNAGSSSQPIYFSSGIPVASTASIGSANQPVYLKNGVITPCTSSNNGIESSIAYTITGSNNNPGWHCLGTLVSKGDASEVIIDVYSGNGYNGAGNQNTHISIFVKDGWQSSTSATASFGISYLIDHSDINATSIQVKGMATAHNTIAIYVYLPWGYFNGYYKVSGYYTSWTNANTHSTTAPTSGTEQNSVLGTLMGSKIYGAVWNDYAEYRQSNEKKAGLCVIETGKGNLIKSSQRLQPGANIISDTFGFAIGETSNTKTPLAVSGRVLAYPYENKNEYKAGDAVCSGPNGTISKMTRQEIIKYPDRIIGTVSEIPNYEFWGTGNVKVNGRIWIKVK